MWWILILILALTVTYWSAFIRKLNKPNHVQICSSNSVHPVIKAQCTDVPASHGLHTLSNGLPLLQSLSQSADPTSNIKTQSSPDLNHFSESKHVGDLAIEFPKAFGMYKKSASVHKHKRNDIYVDLISSCNVDENVNGHEFYSRQNTIRYTTRPLHMQIAASSDSDSKYVNYHDTLYSQFERTNNDLRKKIHECREMSEAQRKDLLEKADSHDKKGKELKQALNEKREDVFLTQATVIISKSAEYMRMKEYRVVLDRVLDVVFGTADDVVFEKHCRDVVQGKFLSEFRTFEDKYQKIINRKCSIVATSLISKFPVQDKNSFALHAAALTSSVDAFMKQASSDEADAKFYSRSKEYSVLEDCKLLMQVLQVNDDGEFISQAQPCLQPMQEPSTEEAADATPHSSCDDLLLLIRRCITNRVEEIRKGNESFALELKRQAEFSQRSPEAIVSFQDWNDAKMQQLRIELKMDCDQQVKIASRKQVDNILGHISYRIKGLKVNEEGAQLAALNLLSDCMQIFVAKESNAQKYTKKSELLIHHIITQVLSHVWSQDINPEPQTCYCSKQCSCDDMPRFANLLLRLPLTHVVRGGIDRSTMCKWIVAEVLRFSRFLYPDIKIHEDYAQARAALASADGDVLSRKASFLGVLVTTSQLQQLEKFLDKYKPNRCVDHNVRVILNESSSELLQLGWKFLTRILNQLPNGQSYFALFGFLQHAWIVYRISYPDQFSKALDVILQWIGKCGYHDKCDRRRTFWNEMKKYGRASDTQLIVPIERSIAFLALNRQLQVESDIYTVRNVD
jgi:hypothetical protein